MNKNYLKGRRFEYSVSRYLKKDGWIVMRTVGSHRPFDLIAIKDNRILLLQLKKWKKMSEQKRREELNKLSSLGINKQLYPTIAVVQNLDEVKALLLSPLGALVLFTFVIMAVDVFKNWEKMKKENNASDNTNTKD
jgi:Holliday junction resolvase